jgi:LDH2 family malate/lactate/ureidoglycolate dehydrogenase
LRAAQTGIAVAAVKNSHHFGMASYPLDAVASAGRDVPQALLDAIYALL